MGAESDFYIAWDGQRYAGSPPPGWYLAADNRWWPSPDVSDGSANGDDAAFDDGSAAAGVGTSDPYGGGAGPSYDRGGTPSPAGTSRPPESWAPESSAPSSDEELTYQTGQPWPDPATAGPGHGQTQTRQPGQTQTRPPGNRQRGRFRLGPTLFLIFVLYRCGTGIVSGSDDPTPAPGLPPTSAPTTVAPTTTLPPTTTTGDGQTTAPAAQTTFENELGLASILSCGPVLVTGTVASFGDEPAEFLLTVTIDGSDEILVVADAQPGQSELWAAGLPGNDAPVSCEIVDISTP